MTAQNLKVCCYTYFQCIMSVFHLASKIWIYMYRSTYANLVSHVKDVCYGMTCQWGKRIQLNLMHLKVTIISTLDEDSPHTMAFVFVVLHVPCFKPIHVMSLKYQMASTSPWVIICEVVAIMVYDYNTLLCPLVFPPLVRPGCRLLSCLIIHTAWMASHHQPILPGRRGNMLGPRLDCNIWGPFYERFFHCNSNLMEI